LTAPSPSTWAAGTCSPSTPSPTAARKSSWGEARSPSPSPTRFERYIDLYHRAAEQFGTIAHPVGMHSPGFLAEIEHGSLYIGSPDTVARKIATAIKGLGVGRFDLIYTNGAQPISARLRSVELYGSKVVPMVRDILAS
jgi:hypothetical protein